MRKPTKPIRILGLTIAPVGLVMLTTSCLMLLQYVGCPTNLNIRWFQERGNRSWPIQIAVAEAQSFTIASFFNELGGAAFPWGPLGSETRSADLVQPRALLFSVGFRFLKEDGQKQSTAMPTSQNEPGAQIYFVGVPANSVTVLNSETAAQMGLIAVGMDPRWIKVSPDHAKAYVSNRGSDSISVIDTATMAVEQTIDLAAGSGPFGVAPGPDGQRVYVVNSQTNSLSAVDLLSGDIIATSDAGDGALHVAISPDGQLAYVTNQNAGTVSVFDTLSMELVTTISGVPGATAVTFEDRGRKAFVTGGSSGTGRLYVVSTSDHSISGTVRVGSDPVSVRLSPYGNFLFVANRGSGSISIIDVRTETVRQTVPVGQSPVDVSAVL